jgi:hypothetical protein
VFSTVFSFFLFYFTLPALLGSFTTPSLAGKGHVRIPLAPAALCPLRQ